MAIKWPLGVRVGHTSPKSGRMTVTLHASNVELTPDEAREVARELILRADFQDRKPDTRMVNEIPRRVPVSEDEGSKNLESSVPSEKS